MNQYCNRRWKYKSPHLGIIMLFPANRNLFCTVNISSICTFFEKWEGSPPASTNLIIHMSLTKLLRAWHGSLMRFSFCLLKSQLDTICKGDPDVLQFTSAHSAVLPAPITAHRPQPATFPTHSQTDTVNVLIHCSSAQHESIWFPKCSRVCSGLWFCFFSPPYP